ncbi:hypothetical protein PIB30_069458 [Stylosanthes scabra]|uniref:Transposase MuDR plant domain-containing protein n=1 Tax=Stylosanthes scabra TaxID=79078 RepID=A0ABU6SNL0_9FABA|nr:hypothetical protein [Stylosanthes scabra]
MGLQEIKRVKKIYYRYPIEEDGGFYYKRYRLRQEDDIVIIQSWHNHFPTIHLLELFVVFADVGDSGSFDVGVDTQSSSGVGTNIRRLMVNLNITHDGSIEGLNPGVDVPAEDILEEEIESHERFITGDPMTHPNRVNPTLSDDEEVEVEDDVMPEDKDAVDDEDIHEEVLEETNFFIHGQPSLTQPAITERYDHPGHFTSLHLNVMRQDRSFLQGGPDDDPTNEFEVGQQFDNKEAVLMAVKTYSIRRAVEYKILESEQLKYSVRCIQHGAGCPWSIRISYRRK